MHSRTHALRRTVGRGFTLLEMMLVIMIIGLLMGVAVWNIVGMGAKARRSATVASMRMIDGALKAYVLTNGSYPPTLDPLVDKYLEKVPLDAWKRPFVYFPNPPGQTPKFQLFSTGESGQQGGDDNIDFWKVDSTGEPTTPQ